MMAREANEEGTLEVIVVLDGRDVSLSFGAKSLSLTAAVPFSGKRRVIKVAAYEILWVEAKGEGLELSFLERDAKPRLALVKIEGKIKDGESSGVDAVGWCEELMSAAYAGPDVKRSRRLKVLVNPHGGPGKARRIYTSDVEPIFKAARCDYDTTYTDHSKHAVEIAQELPLEYDAVVTVSGDGLIHEVFNGFSAHKDSAKAFLIPIVPVPTGSGNGTSINILGLEDGLNVRAAALNAIKGRHMKQDLCLLIQGDTRVITYMSQALGLMADLDLGTENLRWMGDTRFILGFVRGLLQPKPCPVTLSIKVAEQDKYKMAETLRGSGDSKNGATSPTSSLLGGADSDGAIQPLLKYSMDESAGDGWITFDKPLLYIYAGKGPYVGRDLMQFPVSLAADGVVDVVVQELSTRNELLGSMGGAEKGEAYWTEKQHYFKAHAYRVTPHSDEGNLSIDGERYPFRTFEIQVLPRAATFLSPTGQYASDFDFGKGRKRKTGQPKPRDSKCCGMA